MPSIYTKISDEKRQRGKGGGRKSDQAKAAEDRAKEAQKRHNHEAFFASANSKANINTALAPQVPNQTSLSTSSTTINLPNTIGAML